MSAQMGAGMSQLVALISKSGLAALVLAVETESGRSLTLGGGVVVDEV
jgi:hypothetical protein